MPDERRIERRRTALANDAQARRREAQMAQALAAQRGPAMLKAALQRSGVREPDEGDLRRIEAAVQKQARRAAKRMAWASR